MITLESRALRVSVLPEVGGKVGRIQCVRSGHDYLVEPMREYRTLSANEGWTSGDLSGMDDCFPTIAPGSYPFSPWKGVSLPELGNWVYGRYQVLSRGPREVVMRHAGEDLPYELHKRITLEPPETLLLNYQVRNLSASPMPFLWSSHPLFKAGPGFRLRLPAGETSFSVRGEDQARDWPRFRSVDLSREWIPEGTFLKIFVSGLSQGWCELESDGHRVRLDFDLEAAPFLGIWFNHLGFRKAPRPFRCIALEPCTSPADDLEELDPDRYPRLQGGDSRAWEVRLGCCELGT